MGIESIWEYGYDPFEDLTAAHLKQLKDESGLMYEILEHARPFSLNGRFVREQGLREKILERLSLPNNYNHDVLIFPYPGYGGTFRGRLDVPGKDREGKPIRYMQPRKQRNVMYVIPNKLDDRYPNVMFVTEGEKKTLALAQAGCNVTGFGGVWNWRDKSSPSGVVSDFESLELLGKTVAVTFDSDIVTNVNVQKAEDSLVEFCLGQGASKVLRIRIPNDTEQKQGIDDYLRDRDWNTIDKLLKDATVETGFVTGVELMAKKLAPSTMLTDFLPSRSLVLVAGVPGAGKTEFLINQAICAAKKGSVIYYLNEGGQLDLQTRQNAYCTDRDILKNLLWEQKRWLCLSNNEGIEKFERIIRTHKPKLVIIDPGPDAFGEENEAKELKEPLGRLYQLTEKYNMCIVLSWHYSKGLQNHGVYSFRGSSAIAGKMDLIYLVNSSGKKRLLKLAKLRLDCGELAQDQQWAINVTKTDAGKEMSFSEYQDTYESRNEQKAVLLQESLGNFEAGREYTATQITETLLDVCNSEFKKSTAQNYLRQWVKDGYFELIKNKSGPHPAIYKRTQKEADKAA